MIFPLMVFFKFQFISKNLNDIFFFTRKIYVHSMINGIKDFPLLHKEKNTDYTEDRNLIKRKITV